MDTAGVGEGGGKSTKARDVHYTLEGKKYTRVYVVGNFFYG
jgi:hypothetical protein